MQYIFLWLGNYLYILLFPYILIYFVYYMFSLLFE